MADVGVSVGVGRAVVEAEDLLGFSLSLPCVQLVKTTLLHDGVTNDQIKNTAVKKKKSVV